MVQVRDVNKLVQGREAIYLLSLVSPHSQEFLTILRINICRVLILLEACSMLCVIFLFNSLNLLKQITLFPCLVMFSAE